MIHAKDLSGERTDSHVKFAALGKGILDWPEIFKAGEDARVEWYIYEQDNCDGDPFDAARISFEFLERNVK